jgi:hypothetical protein
MRRWSTTLCSLLSAATIAVISSAAAVGSAYASTPPSQCPLASSTRPAPEPESEPSAQADAAATLAELTLPPGSSESSTDPAEGGSALASPGFGPPANPNAVDDHAWWVVPLTPTETVAYIYAHLPPCTTQPLPEHTISGFTWPGNPGTLVVWAVRLADGSTALRVDAQVVWITPRPASERIPSGAHLLKISIHEPGDKRFKGIRSSSERAAVLRRLPSHVTSTAQIDKVAALLNELRVHQPGIRHCPVAPAGSVQVSFYTNPSAPPLAIADIHTEGCGGVSLTIDGITEPRLEGGWYLVEEIIRILGIRPAPEEPKPQFKPKSMISRERRRPPAAHSSRIGGAKRIAGRMASLPVGEQLWPLRRGRGLAQELDVEYLAADIPKTRLLPVQCPAQRLHRGTRRCDLVDVEVRCAAKDALYPHRFGMPLRRRRGSAPRCARRKRAAWAALPDRHSALAVRPRRKLADRT